MLFHSLVNGGEAQSVSQAVELREVTMPSIVRMRRFVCAAGIVIADLAS